MFHLPEQYTLSARNLEKDANPSDTLFHYTNSAGLVGILKSQQLWLGHFNQLNDKSEIFHALDNIRLFILGQAPKGNLHLFWEDIFEDIQNFVFNEYDFYVCSFCMKKNYLTAWHKYAEDATGFSIGFRKEFFTGISNAVMQPDVPPFSRCRVYYDFRQIEKDIEYLAKVTQEDLLNSWALRNTEEARAKRIIIAKCFMASLLPFLSANKNDSYLEEHEHRIYTSMPKSASLQAFSIPDSDSSKPPRKKVFFQFDLNNISEIWVGPSADFEEAKLILENTLSALREEGKCTSDIKIIPSQLPL